MLSWWGKNFIKLVSTKLLFLACTVDETTDTSKKTSCSIVIKLIDSNGEIQEYFLRYYEVNEDRTAEGLCSVLCKAPEIFNIQSKLIPHTYDGASVMSGELNWLNAKFVILHCKLCLFIPWHHLTLVLQQSCSEIKSVNILFSTVQGTPAFFCHSSKHTVVADKVLGSNCLQAVKFLEEPKSY